MFNLKEKGILKNILKGATALIGSIIMIRTVKRYGSRKNS